MINDVKFCKLCTISNFRPSSSIEFKNNNTNKTFINFKDGICEPCLHNINNKKNIDWERKNKLNNLLESIKSDKQYDIIVPSSGGKDSTIQCHILKNIHKAKILSITWAPIIYSTLGFMNFQNMIHSVGVDNILFHTNGKVHRLLTRLAFEKILHPFQPFILRQKNCGVKFAIDNNINTFFYGENEAEYGNSSDDHEVPTRKLDYCSVDDDTDFNELIISGVKVKDLIKNFLLIQPPHNSILLQFYCF